MSMRINVEVTVPVLFTGTAAENEESADEILDALKVGIACENLNTHHIDKDGTRGCFAGTVEMSEPYSESSVNGSVRRDYTIYASAYGDFPDYENYSGNKKFTEQDMADLATDTAVDISEKAADIISGHLYGNDEVMLDFVSASANTEVKVGLSSEEIREVRGWRDDNKKQQRTSAERE